MALSALAEELKVRLANPAVADSELEIYVTAAKRSVQLGIYSNDDYTEQVLDSACHNLLVDGKFPEVNSVSTGGVSTSFAAQDPDRFLKRMNARREAYWMDY